MPVRQRVAQQERGAALPFSAELVQPRALELAPYVLGARADAWLPLGHAAARQQPLRPPRPPCRSSPHGPLQRRVGIWKTSKTPHSKYVAGRQRRGDAQPAHLSLLAHLLERANQAAALALLHRGVVELHDVHRVGLQPAQALLQVAQHVLPGPQVPELDDPHFVAR